MRLFLFHRISFARADQTDLNKKMININLLNFSIFRLNIVLQKI